jgi:O-antigen/teichoic acid export membrane protein
MALKTLIGLGIFTLINIWTMNVYLASTGFILSFGLVLLFYDMPVVAKFDKIVIGFGGNIYKLLKRCFPVFIFAFLTLSILGTTRIVVERFLDLEMVATFNILMLPVAILPLMVHLIFQPFMMELTFSLHNKEYERFTKRVWKLFLLLFVAGIIIIPEALLIGIPVLSFIYNADLGDFRWSLGLMVFAGIAGGASTVFSLLMTLMRQFNIQIVLFVVTFIFGIMASVFFVREYGIHGAFIGFTITITVQMMLFLISYSVKYRIYKNKRVNKL